MIVLKGVVTGIIDIPELVIPGGFCAVFGPNGSGKSTLLRLLSGLDLPERGSIEVGGSSPREIVCGYVSEFPDRNMIFERVADEISSPLKFMHLDSSSTGRMVTELVEKMNIRHLCERNVMRLSGGEKVIVALATAISAGPELLVMDETDSHLDRDTAGEVFETVSGMKIPNVVFCTQDMDRVLETADFAVYMEKGRVIASGTPESVFEMTAGTCFQPSEHKDGTS